MDTAARGNLTEAAVVRACIEHGYDVLLPFGDGQPFDLALHLSGGCFVRVQCKTARVGTRGCLQFNSRTTDHGRGRLPYDGLADVFGVHFPVDGSVFLVPVGEASTYVCSLRTSAPLNNQRRFVRFADDYRIDRWSSETLRSHAACSHAG